MTMMMTIDNMMHEGWSPLEAAYAYTCLWYACHDGWWILLVVVESHHPKQHLPTPNEIIVQGQERSANYHYIVALFSCLRFSNTASNFLVERTFLAATSAYINKAFKHIYIYFQTLVTRKGEEYPMLLRSFFAIPFLCFIRNTVLANNHLQCFLCSLSPLHLPFLVAHIACISCID